MSQIHVQKRFAVSEVAADKHELNELLDPQCSMHTYHRPNQLHPVARKLPISRPADGRRLS